MHIELDRQLNIDLRNKFNEHPEFIDAIRAEFLIPGKKGEKRELKTYNCVCAVLDRIDSLVEHLNSIEIEHTGDGVFALCDLLNYGQVLIDCVTRVAHIFGVKDSLKSDISIFHQPGSNGKGSDEKYFKYLRSLCAVHPVDTTQHSEYQGEEPEWCPYIEIGGGKSIISIFDKENADADFYAIVYRNDLEFNKRIPIRLHELFAYISKRYDFLTCITSALDATFSECIQILKEKHIPNSDGTPEYLTYLTSLSEAVAERCGGSEMYLVNEWKAIFSTSFNDSLWQRRLLQYQETLKKGIVTVHQRLQNMEYDDNGTIDLTAIEFARIEQLDDYWYEQSKIEYLYPSGRISGENCNLEDFINEPLDLEKGRLEIMLQAIDAGYIKNFEHEEIRDIARLIDSKMNVSNSEWARVQIRIIEKMLGNNCLFDYYQNDWKLYLQTQIVFWMLGSGMSLSD